MPGASDQPLYPAALVLDAFIASQHGDQARAIRRCDEALAAERRLGTEPSIMVWLMRSEVAMAQGHADEAIEHAARAIALARARDVSLWLLWGLTTSALARALTDDTAGALAEAEEAVALTHRLPNSSMVRVQIGRAAFALGASEPDRALALIRSVLESAPAERSGVWGVAADLAWRTGDRRAGLGYYARAIDGLRWLGTPLFLGVVIGSAATLLVDDDPEAAAILSGAGDTLAPDYPHAPHRAEAERRADTTLQASLGAQRRAELRARGAAMDDAEAAAYAEAAIARFLGRNGP
jgi:tetratricopeptide (TPR) repeat protein